MQADEVQNNFIKPWDEWFMDLAAHWAQRSKDPSTKVGAIITDGHKTQISSGYNGFAAGMDDDPKLYADRFTKYQRVIHAELNAILNSVLPIRMMTQGHGQQATLYVTMFPCHECAKASIQAGIRRIVTPPAAAARWDDSHKAAVQFFREAGVVVDHYYVSQQLKDKYPMTFKE